MASESLRGRKNPLKTCKIIKKKPGTNDNLCCPPTHTHTFCPESGPFRQFMEFKLRFCSLTSGEQMRSNFEESTYVPRREPVGSTASQR